MFLCRIGEKVSPYFKKPLPMYTDLKKGALQCLRRFWHPSSDLLFPHGLNTVDAHLV